MHRASSEGIREAIEKAGAYLSDHPEDARYTDSQATAVIQSGLRATVSGPAGASLTTDMPSSVGGTESAPSAGWFLRAAEASCAATLIAMRAAQLNVSLDRIEVTVDSESDDRGILGIDHGTPAGPLSTRVHARIVAASAERGQLDQIVRWAIDHCPVIDAVRRAVPLTIDIEIG